MQNTSPQISTILCLVFAALLFVDPIRAHADSLSFFHDSCHTGASVCSCSACRTPPSSRAGDFSGDGSQTADGILENGGTENPPMPPAAALPGNSQFHIGIDFIKTRIVADPGFLFDFTPYSVVGPNTNFVTQGGVGTLTEHQVQRQIIMAVEDSFRQINTGNAQTTVAIAIHDGVVNTNLPGRRLNVAMAGSIQELGLLGQAKQTAYTGSFPQDGYAAVTYLDRIDQMGDGGHIVVYDTLPEIVYAVAGTTAHEIGHVFDAVHVNTTANVSPQPLMASSGTGLPAAARFVKREFSITQPAGTSNALTILNNAGTVVRGDSNMDQIVDGLDLSIVFSNWALDDRLFHEGDANNDHLVDGLDVAQVFSNWTSDSSSTTSFTQSISGTFNPQTGEVTVSSDGVANWFLQSDTGGLAFANAFEILSGFEGVALSQNANRVGMASIGSAPLSSLAFDSLSLGPIAAIGSLDLQLLYNASQGSPLQSARLTIVPEPTGCMGVAAVIYLCSQRRNFRYSPR